MNASIIINTKCQFVVILRWIDTCTGSVETIIFEACIRLIFSLEMFLHSVVNIFGGFERFWKHAYAFQSWNVLAQHCERFRWFWTFLGFVGGKMYTLDTLNLQWFIFCMLSSVTSNSKINGRTTSKSRLPNEWACQALFWFMWYITTPIALRSCSQIMHCIP